MANFVIFGFLFFGISFVFGYFKGKQAKENEVIKNNNKKQKLYEKPSINSNFALSDKLQNGKY